MSELTLWTPARGECLPAGGCRVTTLDLTDPTHQRLAYRAHVGADKLLSDCIGATLDVAHVYAHHVIRVDEETGEERPGLRAVLILADGTRVATSSEMAYKCILAWAAVAQLAPPWSPPLRFLVKSEPSKRGPGKYLWLDLPEASNGKAKGK